MIVMRRRRFLAIAAGGVSTIAGCTGGGDNPDWDEEIAADTITHASTFAFNAEAGDRVEIHVDVEDGSLAYVRIWHHDGDDLLYEEFLGDEVITATIEESGPHSFRAGTDGQIHVSAGLVTD